MEQSKYGDAHIQLKILDFCASLALDFSSWTLMSDQFRFCGPASKCELTTRVFTCYKWNMIMA